MTKREARKTALREVSTRIRNETFVSPIIANMNGEDAAQVRAAIAHIADHLEWEAAGRGMKQ